MATGLYLYGIIPAPAIVPLELEGLDKQPVQMKTIEHFVFLYSEAQQERYLSSRRNLLGHEKVLEAAMEQGYRTLLPLRFGLNVQDWDAVNAQLLHPYSEDMTGLLQKLEGHREVSVKIFWNPELELQAMLAENETLRSQRDGLSGRALSMDETIRMGQAIEQAMKQRQDAIAQTVREMLMPLAVEVRENDNINETMIFNTAYLIPWNSEPDFAAQVDAIDQRFAGQLTIRYNNFTAPYNFAMI